VQRWRRSLFIDCSQTESKHHSTSQYKASLRSLGGY